MQRGVCMCKKDQINQNRYTKERRGLDFGRLDTERERCTGKLQNLSEIGWLA